MLGSLAGEGRGGKRGWGKLVTQIPEPSLGTPQPFGKTHLLIDVSPLAPPANNGVARGLGIDGWLTVDSEDATSVDVRQLL